MMNCSRPKACSWRARSALMSCSRQMQWRSRAGPGKGATVRRSHVGWSGLAPARRSRVAGGGRAPRAALAHGLGQVIDRGGHFRVSRKQHIHAHQPAGAGRRDHLPIGFIGEDRATARVGHDDGVAHGIDHAVEEFAMAEPAAELHETGQHAEDQEQSQQRPAPPRRPAATAPPHRAGPAPPPRQARPEARPAEAQRPPVRAGCQRPRAPQYRPQPAPICRSCRATPNQTEYRTFGHARDHSTRPAQAALHSGRQTPDWILRAARFNVMTGANGMIRKLILAAAAAAAIALPAAGPARAEVDIGLTYTGLRRLLRPQHQVLAGPEHRRVQVQPRQAARLRGAHLRVHRQAQGQVVRHLREFLYRPHRRRRPLVPLTGPRCGQ